MDDPDIIRLFFSRSEQAIAETRSKYGAYCMAIARSILGRPEDCEECLNDVWLKLWHTIPPQQPRCLRAFAGTVTRTRALSIFRASHARKRGSGVPELALAELEACIPQRSAEEEAAARALPALLDRFLAGLPKRPRVIFVKRYWYLLPIRQIAAEVGCREGAVRTSLFRTRAQLRAMLEKEGFFV